MRHCIEMFGREVVVEVSEELDHYGQFRVALVVDDKERYAMHFTDKSEDRRQPSEEQIAEWNRPLYQRYKP